MASDAPPLELYYFGLYAKFGSALALEHSGLSWIYKRPEDWKSMKPTLAFGCLPVLKNLPAEHVAGFCGAGDAEDGNQLGQEIAILNYVGSRVLKMKGLTTSDELISQQLIGAGEDIYQALSKIKNRIISYEDSMKWWSKDAADPMSHNRNFGVYVYLENFEKFAKKCACIGKAAPNKFTSCGCTVGECKLFASLFCLVAIEPDLLANYEALKHFYEAFLAESATQAVLSGDKTGGVLAQYFHAPEENRD